MTLSDNGPSNNSHLRAHPERRAEAGVQPLLAGNRDQYLSADFVFTYWHLFMMCFII